MDFTIRRLTESDAPLYFDLRLEALESEPLAFGQSPEEHRRCSVEETAALLCHEKGFLVGAFDDKALVAFARFEREPNIKERHKGHIYGVYVTTSRRGKGLARRVIVKLIELASDIDGLEHILLSTGTHNMAARTVYKSLGFIPYGIEPRALKVGSEYIDEEHMILYLD